MCQVECAIKDPAAYTRLCEEERWDELRERSIDESIACRCSAICSDRENEAFVLGGRALERAARGLAGCVDAGPAPVAARGTATLE
jgi:hypothetical protein